MQKNTPEDPKGLIFESYRIEQITKAECRTIFLDWALSLPLEEDTGLFLKSLLAHYQTSFPTHPMTEVLNEGLTTLSAPRRRGGWRSRPRH
ncbi:MAG: hypothetical protein ABJL67_09585 [Sulfitobacter sp.]